MKRRNGQIKLAIFDLTDCEGCELQFLALREKLSDLGQDFEIANWRLASQGKDTGPYDAVFIEGSPITESDIAEVKQARAQSKSVIALGTCACLGGVQSDLAEKDREKNIKSVYGADYTTSSKAPKPLSYYIDVDVNLFGCPINPDELEVLLSSLFARKMYRPKNNAVCLDCKKAQNACLFLEEGFCLGPVTRGGCGAPCPSGGLRCYGCFGPLGDANLEALEKASDRSKREIEKSLSLFMKNTDEFKDYITKNKGRRK